MTQKMNLLYPEWQGGRCPDVHRGAHWLAEAVFAGRGYVTIDAPAAQPGEVESTAVVDGVYALPTIAARFARTLEVLGRARPGRLLTVSGTCGGEAAPIAWLNNRYAGKLAVLWFDAHGDLNTPQTSSSEEITPPCRMPWTKLPISSGFIGRCMVTRSELSSSSSMPST